MSLFKKNKNITLEKIIESWLLYKKYNIKESTYYRYQYIINEYILKYFKNKKLSYFENYDFNIFTNELEKTLANKTIKDIMVVLKSILKFAERKYNCDFKLDLISAPKVNDKEIKILTKSEKSKLEKICYQSFTPKDIGIIICLNTGLRIGEICALTWNDIDLSKNLLNVNKTMQRIYKSKNNTKISISTPKSKKSFRKIPISNKVSIMLKELKEQYKCKENEYFLTGSTEKYIEPRNYQYTFKKKLKECNIQSYNFHTLRHTFASNCIEIGMDIKSLSEILGHSTVEITLNKYVHSSFNIQKKYLEKL